MRRLVLVIMAELILAVGLGGWVVTKVYTMRTSISGLNKQIARLQPTVKEIKHYEDASKKLAPKLELLGNAKDQTMRWYNTLDKLTQSLASTTYLTRIGTTTSNTQEATTTVSLNGLSSEQGQVGETMLRLQNIPDFEKVDLHYTQTQTQADGMTGIEFEIGANMKSSEPKKEVKTDGSNQS